MHYVYILKSQKHPSRIYIGQTRDLKRRFTEHNQGENKSTKFYSPWKLMTYHAFSDKPKAIRFEKYLKSGSGREFIRKRLLH